MQTLDIYGLYVDGPEGVRRYFYVGRSKDVGRRAKQHGYATQVRHEDVYEHLRALEADGTPWHLAVLETVTEDDWWPDAERWHVIRLIRDGHDLRNMRHGSRAHLEELAGQVKARHIRSAADVRSDRLHRGQMTSRRHRRKVLRGELAAMIRRGEVRDVVACTALQALAPVTYRRLASRWTGPDKTSLGTDMDLKTLVERARTIKRYDEFQSWIATLKAEGRYPGRGGRPSAGLST